MKAEEIYKKIIKEFVKNVRKIIGNVALTQANKVQGLKINSRVQIEGDPVIVLTRLLERYQKLIGPISRTLAIKSAQPILAKYPELRDKVPDWLCDTIQLKFGKYLCSF